MHRVLGETRLIRASRRLADERGISLIMVAIQLLVLTAMTSFVLDYGVMWLSREQAQNAADAGALAGANSLASDDKTWPAPAGGAAVNAATTVARAHRVFGDTPGTVVSSVCPPWMTAPNNINCIQVDVYRDGTNASTVLPVYFAQVVGVTSQRVRATATAQVLAANTSGCMRPWFIPDWYQENGGDPNTYTSPPDVYTFPGYDPDLPPATGRGIGAAVVFHNNGGPSSYGQLDVGNGGAAIRHAIRYCYDGPPFSIGDDAPVKPGNTLGPERQGIDDLLTWDPDSGGVHWDAAKMKVVGGCASTGTCNCGPEPCPYGGALSPRIVQAAICSPAEAKCAGTVPGNGTVHITNILSFFITGYSGGGGTLDIHAILIGSAGMLEAGPTVGPGESFLNVTMLVR